MKKLSVSIIVILVSVFMMSGIAVAKDRVVVYTSLETEETVEYLKLAKKELPDLVLIDGGKGQLSAALAALEEAGVGDMPVASIANSKCGYPWKPFGDPVQPEPGHHAQAGVDEDWPRGATSLPPRVA